MLYVCCSNELSLCICFLKRPTRASASFSKPHQRESLDLHLTLIACPWAWGLWQLLPPSSHFLHHYSHPFHLFLLAHPRLFPLNCSLSHYLFLVLPYRCCYSTPPPPSFCWQPIFIASMEASLPNWVFSIIRKNFFPRNLGLNSCIYVGYVVVGRITRIHLLQLISIMDLWYLRISLEAIWL